ncbi:hypothetical protein [Spartinivicinus ruber]|uniref:hypothetical protein n=1 Tax=Spartinivicinus ruber TaxID=2683272 RepID=UPI0013D771A3|nr:hypothetical protein [Spartinivicinus ruber]
MNKPTSVKAILLISTLQVVACILLVLLSLLFAFNDMPEGFLANFEKGFLKSAGYDPVTFNEGDAGAISGNAVFETIFPFLVLIGMLVRWRWLLYPSTILAVLIQLASLSNGGSLPLFSFIVAFLTFRKRTSNYLKEVKVESSESDAMSAGVYSNDIDTKKWTE